MKVLPENINIKSTYSSTRLRSHFTKTKYCIEKEHKHNIVYCVRCLKDNCTEHCHTKAIQVGVRT